VLPPAPLAPSIAHAAQPSGRQSQHACSTNPLSFRCPPRQSTMSSTSLSLAPTAVSCPAKVLVAGGYLVLDRDYTGLVFGLDARIHTVVEPIKTKSGVTISGIVVTSPQFREAIWEYGYRAEAGDGGMAVTQLSV